MDIPVIYLFTFMNIHGPLVIAVCLLTFANPLSVQAQEISESKKRGEDHGPCRGAAAQGRDRLHRMMGEGCGVDRHGISCDRR